MLRRLWLLASIFIGSADAATLAHYNVGESGRVWVDEISGERTPVTGLASEKPGPVGAALQLDGLSTAITPRPIPRLTETDEPWSISCWIKLDAWPWNDTPIVDQATSAGRLFFGVDALGHLVAERRVSGQKAVRVVSSDHIPPRTWTSVAVSYNHGGLSLAVNGKGVPGDSSAPGETTPTETSLLIGHTRTAQLPYPSNAIHPLLPIQFSLEGALADLIVTDHSLTAADLKKRMSGADGSFLRATPPPALPRWSGGPGAFGAFHTTLHYDTTWDSARRVAPDSDVVVRFPQAPIQLVFWQGANYIPAWVTENGRWYSDEFMEIYGKPRCPDGEDCEPMSDKQVRYSHVEILESTPARAVVHWRYALSEVENQKLADAPTPADWGAWADEYWTVYPDATAVRRQVLWTDHPGRESSEFQESIVIIPAGETPEDNLHLDALTLANLNGESRTYTWPARTASGFAKPKGVEKFEGLDAPMIQWINLRSQWKPFQVAGAGPARFEGINWEPSLSAFEWWNHWPVAQIRSSGRPALIADRPSHTSLSHIYWPVASQDAQRMTRLLLTGLTLDRADQMAPRARAWLTPPPAQAIGAAAVHFEPGERAYVIEGVGDAGSVRIDIDADEEHPVVNPAFVVPHWRGGARVELEGAQVGIVDRLEGRQLVVYVPVTATHRVSWVLTRTE